MVLIVVFLMVVVSMISFFRRLMSLVGSGDAVPVRSMTSITDRFVLVFMAVLAVGIEVEVELVVDLDNVEEDAIETLLLFDIPIDTEPFDGGVEISIGTTPPGDDCAIVCCSIL